MTLGPVETLALAGLLVLGGYGLRRIVPVLGRLNIPAPVLGGLAGAALLALLPRVGVAVPTLDADARTPLMVAFFATVGFGASLRLLRRGGPQVALLLGLASVGAVLQNVVGAGIAVSMGQAPLLGVLAGSVTLTGGPATGLAFAPLFEKAGIAGATEIALAAAMAGIVIGGLVGAPLSTWLVGRHGLRPSSPGTAAGAVAGAVAGAATGALPDDAHTVAQSNMPEPPQPDLPIGEDESAYALVRHVVLLLVLVWAGGAISTWVTAAADGGIAFPGYIGALVLAVAVRAVEDRTRWLGLSQRLIDDLGGVCLALFIALALLTLDLSALGAAALPLAVIVAAQTLLVVAMALVPFRLLGRDYDAAVMAGGFVGFMMGTTANALANMGAVAERYGPAPRAFLVVPLVGGLFIDVTNALLISACLSIFG